MIAWVTVKLLDLDLLYFHFFYTVFSFISVFCIALSQVQAVSVYAALAHLTMKYWLAIWDVIATQLPGN